MKIFKKYSPQHIARYVKAFFKGHLYIEGRGAFLFDHGKVMPLANHRTINHQKTAAEINQCIEAMNHHIA